MDDVWEAIVPARVVIPTGSTVCLRENSNRARMVCRYVHSFSVFASVQLGESCPLK